LPPAATRAEVRLRFDSQARGVTPAELQLPHGSEGLQVELRREGISSRRETITPNANQHFDWDLRPLSSAPPSRLPAPRTSRSATPPRAPDFYPFE